MNQNIDYPCTGDIFVEKINLDRNYEFVERKGAGHPDTLADELAEKLSINYSKYTLNNFGVILHHNFDKVGLLGGSSYVNFGEGHLTNPIRVLVNGRLSTRFGNDYIPYEKIIKETVQDYLKEKFPLLDEDKDIRIQNNLSVNSSPGKTDIESSKKGTRRNWFEPESKEDIKELKFLGSNDTSMGVGFAPLTKFEKSIITIEDSLNGDSFKQKNPWLGSDIKIMAHKLRREIDITMCIPQIGKFVKNTEEYKKNLNFIKEYVKNFLEKRFRGYKIRIHLNTRDDFETGELYLAAIGSSIESGDEGLVGRGNRINRIISQTKPYTMEGAAGKNPVYHIGKIYNYAA